MALLARARLSSGERGKGSDNGQPWIFTLNTLEYRSLLETKLRRAVVLVTDIETAKGRIFFLP